MALCLSTIGLYLIGFSLILSGNETLSLPIFGVGAGFWFGEPIHRRIHGLPEIDQKGDAP